MGVRRWALLLSLVVALPTGCADTVDRTLVSASEMPTATETETDASTAASCVEGYSAAGIARRGFAFAGTVTAIGPAVSDRGDGADLDLPGVSFTVEEWFTGGVDQRTVTVDLQIPSEDYDVGTRLLVSGEARWGGQPLDQPIAWACGFTRAYDEADASAWRSATGSS